MPLQTSTSKLPQDQMPVVLVVDDDSSLRRMAVLMLERGGFSTCTACNGLEALQQLEEHPEVEAVLLDMLMPIMDGVSVMREMRVSSIQIPVIVISGFSLGETEERFGEETPTAFLQKPFTMEALTGTIRRSMH